MEIIDTSKSTTTDLSIIQGLPGDIPVKYGSDKVLYEPFLDEVKQHIQSDIEEIKAMFFPGERVKQINIKIAGDETHYKGKVPLFLEFEFEEISTPIIKVVYKPRSLTPDKAVEDTRRKFDPEHEPRKILNKGDHGYDLFVNGSPLKYLTDADKQVFLQEEKDQQLPTLESLIKSSPNGLALIQSLHLLGIEDLHPGNFLYDENQNKLYFVDAECYQTGMSLNLNDLLDKLDFNFEPIPEKENLREHPTRLVFCSTQDYIDHFNGTSLSSDPILFVQGEKILTYKGKNTFDCSQLQREKEFLDYHDALFLKFLHVNDFFEWETSSEEETFISEEEISKKLSSLIGEQGKFNLEATIHLVNVFRKDHGIGEVPSFHFLFNEKKVICDFTKKEINIGYPTELEPAWKKIPEGVNLFDFLEKESEIEEKNQIK